MRNEYDTRYRVLTDYADAKETGSPMATITPFKASLTNRLKYYCRRNIGALLGCAWMGAVVVALSYIGFLVVTR